MDCVKTDLIKSILLGSTAAFAGLGSTLTLVAAPAVLESSDPLPSFLQMYTRGKNMAFSTILPSVASGLILYYRLDDCRFLVAAGLNSLVIPFTLVFMAPVNNALFALKEENSQDLPKARKLLGSWSSLQLVRTTLGVTAFVFTAHAVLKK